MDAFLAKHKRAPDMPDKAKIKANAKTAAQIEANLRANGNHPDLITLIIKELQAAGIIVGVVSFNSGTDKDWEAVPIGEDAMHRLTMGVKTVRRNLNLMIPGTSWDTIPTVAFELSDEQQDLLGKNKHIKMLIKMITEANPEFKLTDKKAVLLVEDTPDNIRLAQKEGYSVAPQVRTSENPADNKYLLHLLAVAKVSVDKLKALQAEVETRGDVKEAAFIKALLEVYKP